MAIGLLVGCIFFTGAPFSTKWPVVPESLIPLLMGMLIFDGVACCAISWDVVLMEVVSSHMVAVLSDLFELEQLL